MKPESKFWKLIKENLKDISWTRFENWASPGVPDVYGIKDGVSIWVELKVITSNKINLSPFQIAWNYKHSLQGGRNFIIATTPSRGLLYIFPGSVVHSIGSIAKLPEPHWSITLVPGPGPWQQVQRILLHSPLPKPEAK